MGRIALVTGSTRGLGAAVAAALQAAGNTVAATYHSDEAAAAAFAERQRQRFYRWNVADEQPCTAEIAQVERELGPVDILVNNAGITRDAALHRMTLEQRWDLIRSNLGSMYDMTRGVIEGLYLA